MRSKRFERVDSAQPGAITLPLWQRDGRNRRTPCIVTALTGRRFEDLDTGETLMLEALSMAVRLAIVVVDPEGLGGCNEANSTGRQTGRMRKGDATGKILLGGPRMLNINDRKHMDGFFTQAFFLRGRPGFELERSLGYAPGRMQRGWWLLFLERMPTPADFEFAGYTYFSGGVPQGHLKLTGGKTAEQLLAEDGVDVFRLKQKIIGEKFRLSGPDRLAKAVPLDAVSGPMPFPPGAGIPQWKLNWPLPFRVADFIGPGHNYNGNYI